jgi:Bacterial regulatory protein, Fis family
MRRIPTLAEVECRHILNTLHLCGNNRTHAAKVLGLSIRGTRLKLHEYEREGFLVPSPNAGARKREMHTESREFGFRATPPPRSHDKWRDKTRRSPPALG